MRGLCVERSCRENISVGWRGADHPLFDIVFDECVNSVSVGFESILPRVAPGFHLLLHSLSEIDDRETAAVADNIVVSHFASPARRRCKISPQARDVPGRAFYS